MALTPAELVLPPVPFPASSASGRPHPTDGPILTLAPVPPPPDVVAPVVDNYDPPIGTAIARTTPIAFDVKDASGLFCIIMVTAKFPDGSHEVIHTGAAFATFYDLNSDRSPIANGFRYTVTRRGGWSGAPTIETFAIDSAGNESN